MVQNESNIVHDRNKYNGIMFHNLQEFEMYFSVKYVTLRLMCVHINLVRFRLLCGHLLGKSCSLG